MNEKKNILIAPLDWGLGHATRCIPIISQLKNEFNVFIASSGGAAVLLKKEFPDLKHFLLPSYKITYPVKRSMSWHMAWQMPSVYSAIVQEKKKIKEIVAKYNIHLIISDNRFGVYAKNIPSVFITHQVNIKTPYLNKWINKLNHKSIADFTECWIPDVEKFPGMAGELSHPAPEKIPIKYIGPLSRFSVSTCEKKYDITVVLSGPEPQRTLLEDILFTELFKYPDLKIKFVRGIYDSNESSDIKNIEVCDNLSSDELQNIMHASKNIICRSGYSSIMDLQFVKANVLFIPTPQQTEQEYLAKLHANKNHCYFQNQDAVDVSVLLNRSTKNVLPESTVKTNFIELAESLIYR